MATIEDPDCCRLSRGVFTLQRVNPPSEQDHRPVGGLLRLTVRELASSGVLMLEAENQDPLQMRRVFLYFVLVVVTVASTVMG